MKTEVHVHDGVLKFATSKEAWEYVEKHFPEETDEDLWVVAKEGGDYYGGDYFAGIAPGEGTPRVITLGEHA